MQTVETVAKKRGKKVEDIYYNNAIKIGGVQTR